MIFKSNFIVPLHHQFTTTIFSTMTTLQEFLNLSGYNTPEYVLSNAQRWYIQHQTTTPNPNPDVQKYLNGVIERDIEKNKFLSLVRGYITQQSGIENLYVTRDAHIKMYAWLTKGIKAPNFLDQYKECCEFMTTCFTDEDFQPNFAD